MLTRRKILVGLAGLGLVSLPRAASSQQSRNVRLIVPAAPGGAIDAIGRLYADRLKDTLGQTWVVENRAGANNTLGAAEVARAAPDGTTLLTNADIHLMAKHVMKQVPYDPVADFSPISRLATSPMVFVGHPGKTPADLRALAAEMKAAPDKHTYSNSGPRRDGAPRQPRASTTGSASRLSSSAIAARRRPSRTSSADRRRSWLPRSAAPCSRSRQATCAPSRSCPSSACRSCRQSRRSPRQGSQD